ncbi:hypothetical protein BDV95DRAFT_149687 [Massariosphaeria phaeospora]|uniref:Uncharacterized protein n=1 Tax=Massariosphaeria phaeospora TaxID=100035 RepID=A0A7C8MIY2_9PLEO|nr:hypothetical protein BDV95DRAFT_149687 [Massariosphaeria phaeospora]
MRIELEIESRQRWWWRGQEDWTERRRFEASGCRRTATKEPARAVTRETRRARWVAVAGVRRIEGEGEVGAACSEESQKREAEEGAGCVECRKARRNGFSAEARAPRPFLLVASGAFRGKKATTAEADYHLGASAGVRALRRGRTLGLACEVQVGTWTGAAL